MVEIKNLSVRYNSSQHSVLALKNINFVLNKSEIIAVVGESGSGKSTLASAIIGTLSSSCALSGEINFNSMNLLGLNNSLMRDYRGRKIFIIPQEPYNGFDPMYKIGSQINEFLFSKNIVLSKINKANILISCGLADVKRIMNAYPHQLSGGMLQRVLIAMSLMAEADLIIADEPTASLDVNVEIDIMRLLKKEVRERRICMIFITHDLGLAKKFSDKLLLLKKGEVCESSSSEDFFNNPKSDYGKILINAAKKIYD